jgi:GlpG protein
MRQIGRLDLEREAERFAAYLVTQGIEAHAEEDGDGFAIWVRDENRIDEARKAFNDFRYEPDNSRYHGAERAAESIRREEVQKRLEAQKNLIEMRGRWKSAHPPQKAPLTFTLIALSVLVTLFGGFGRAGQGDNKKGFGATINQELSFVSDRDYTKSESDPLGSIEKGELWRTITPIFIHLAPLHLIFNMIMFFQFGRLLESMYGTARFAVAVLVIAILSNVAQAVFPASLGGYPFFGGMSGVVYGLFGYAWVRSVFDPSSGFRLSQVTIIVLMGWLFLCMTPAVGRVANVAHVVGLIAGAAFAYLSLLLRR